VEPIIEVRNLRKVFYLGDVELEVLQNINLDIAAGEFVSIMGPSGSGKSTLLYILGSLDRPTQGTVKLKGVDISQLDDQGESTLRRRQIGFIFQFYNLIPNLSVEENILLPVLLDNGDLKAYGSKLGQILELVGLSHRKQHTPRELSGGQQQRVAIARALINDPEIIFADEPIGNLDSKTGEQIMELFRTINRERGVTIVQVTHSLEAAAYGNRIINLRDGKVMEG